GYGFLAENVAARHYRDAKVLEVGEGTTEVQLGVIARELGLRGTGFGTTPQPDPAADPRGAGPDAAETGQPAPRRAVRGAHPSSAGPSPSAACTPRSSSPTPATVTPPAARSPSATTRSSPR